MKLPKSKKDYLYVSIQLILFIAYALPIVIVSLHLPDGLRYIGLLILILGLVLGLMALLQLKTYLSPFPTPVAHGTLVDNGVYKVSRHPIYTALIFSGLGYAIYQVSLYKMIISLALLVLFYFKSKYEEELLTKTYSGYANYKKKTRRFI